MHTPEHVVADGVEMGAGVLAAAAVVHAVRGARAELLEPAVSGERIRVGARVGMVGVTAAMVFALQMLNFPIGSATSGHVIGAALAAVVLGPHLAVLVLTAVLVVQAMLFADGGLGALGVNVLLMAVLAVWVANVASRALAARLPARPALGAAVGALASVPISAIGWVALYVLGGLPVSGGVMALAGQMLGWHALVGLGEAAVTGVLVLAAVSARADLVYAARRQGVSSHSRVGVPGLLTGSAVVVLVLAGVVSRFASPMPDGLEFVSAGFGLDAVATAHGSLLADYGAVAGVDVGVSGVVGAVTVALLAIVAAAFIVRRHPVGATA